MLEEEYRHMYELENSYWWFLAKRRFIEVILPSPSGNLKILDIGAGTGGMSKFLESWGIVTRIESSPVAQKYLKKNHLKFVSKSAESYKYPQNKFDLICIFDVLYHQNIKNDEQTLHSAFVSLKQGGTIIITDSAVPWLNSFHDIRMQTRERYKLSSLEKKVQKSGFRIKKSSYIYFFVFPLFIFTRLVNKFVNFENVKPLSKSINNILLWICKKEASLLPHINYPIGSSIIICAQKTA
jgi:SAM-dependent methyltransferase